MSSHVEPSPRLKKRWIFAIVFFVLLLVGSGILFYQSESNKAAAEKLIAEIKAAGDPIDLTGLAASYNRHRNLNNPAITYQELFKALPKSGSEPKAFGFKGKFWPTPDEAFPPENLARMRAHLETNQPVVALIKEATQGEFAIFDLNFPAGPGMLVPHLGQLKGSAQFAQIACFIAIEDKRSADAVEWFDRMMRIQHTLKPEPTLVGYMVRVSTFQLAIQALERAVVRLDLSPNEVAALQKSLELAPAQTDLMNAMKAERAFGLSIFNNPASMGLNPTGSKIVKALPSWDYDRLQYVNHLTASVRLATNAYPGVLKSVSTLEDDLYRRRGKYGGSHVKKAFFLLHRSSPMTDMLLPALFKAYERQGEILAHVRLARIALEAEKLGSKAQLLSLGDLSLPAADLTDPFTGKPFQLMTTNAFTICYSVGPDLKDGGGLRPEESGDSSVHNTRRAAAGPGRPRNARDIVFQLK